MSILKIVNERVKTDKTSYIVNVFVDGFKTSSTLDNNPKTYLVCKVVKNKVKSFIEVNRSDLVLSTYGTKKEIELLRNEFCIF